MLFKDRINVIRAKLQPSYMGSRVLGLDSSIEGHRRGGVSNDDSIEGHNVTYGVGSLRMIALKATMSQTGWGLYE